jgi:hypothetical protein
LLALALWGFWTALGLALAGLAVAPRRSAPWVVAVRTALGPAAPGQGLELPLAADPVVGRRPGGGRTQRPALALACLLPLLSLHERTSWPPAAMAESYREVAEALTAERAPVVVLSPLVFSFHPVLFERRVADRTPAMTGWPAQAALACPGSPGAPALTEWFRMRLADRLRRGEVGAIYIDTVALRPCPGAPTFGAWLRADPVLNSLVAGFVCVETRWRIEIWRPHGLPAGLSAP